MTLSLGEAQVSFRIADVYYDYSDAMRRIS